MPAKYPGRISTLAAMRASLAGRAARIDGQPVTACPFDPRGDRVEQFLARYWVIGWNRTRV